MLNNLQNGKNVFVWISEKAVVARAGAEHDDCERQRGSNGGKACKPGLWVLPDHPRRRAYPELQSAFFHFSFFVILARRYFSTWLISGRGIVGQLLTRCLTAGWERRPWLRHHKSQYYEI